MTWQDEQKQVATGVTDGTDGRKYSTVFPYEAGRRPVRVDDDDDIQDYKKPWVGLTDEEIDSTFETQVWNARRSYARAIEAKLKEKNT